MKVNKRENGITLIILAVTIVIIMILFGVVIYSLTDNDGIIKKTKEGVEYYKESEEQGEMEKLVASIIVKNMSSRTRSYVGQALLNKNLNTNWSIIYDNTTKTIYGTGWHYIAKGTEIENYGTTERDWIVDYKSGQVIGLTENEFAQISSGDNLAVTTNIMLNIDPSIIDNGSNYTKAQLEAQLGSNVELMNFDFDESSGLTSSSFNFDGENDYIKIQYNSSEQKQQLANNGITFEFFGNIQGGTSYNTEGTVLDTGTSGYRGLMCYWNGNEAKQAKLRFGVTSNGTVVYWNPGYKNVVSDYSNSTSNWNQLYKFKNSLLNKDLYFTITLDTSSSYQKDGVTYYKQTLYIDGEKTEYDGGLNKEQWDDFVNTNGNLNALNYFCIGRSSMSNEGWWHYSKMNCYSMRLYSRGLTSQEVKNNYNKTIAYYSLLNN